MKEERGVESGVNFEAIVGMGLWRKQDGGGRCGRGRAMGLCTLIQHDTQDWALKECSNLSS